MSYNPEDFNEEAEAIESGEYGLRAEITEVNMTDRAEAYGDEKGRVKHGEPDDPMIEVVATTEAGDELTDYFSPPKGATSWASPDFKLGKFRDRYDTVPVEGLEVEVTVSGDGFLDIEY